MNMHERESGDLKQLKRRVREEKDADRRDRLRAVVLALEGEEAAAIARLPGRSRRQVQAWAYAYRDGGIEAIHPPRRKGRAPRVRGDIAQRLKARLDAGPTETDKVCTLRGRDVQRILRQEMGVKLSLNAAYANDTRTHNNPNEIVTRDTDSNASVDYTLVYDKVGNLTDDNQSYKFVYDVLGRLRKIKNQSNNLVAEYTYNGLGYRIGWHYDVTRSGGGLPDGTVDGNDPWYWFCHDERWRIIATYRSTDSDPKERFVYHASGLDGMGGSSYIDSVVLRDRDSNTAWKTASDGVLEYRVFPCQNWRADVSAVIDYGGSMVEWVKYSAYGRSFGFPHADTDSDGNYDTTDESNISGWGAAAYDVRADYNFDGAVDGTDAALIPSVHVGATLAAAALSTVDSRKGYAGYENSYEIVRFSHVRHRVLDSGLGRWTTRDPAGYVDGSTLLVYVGNRAIGAIDPSGQVLQCAACIGCIIGISASCLITCGLDPSPWASPPSGHSWSDYSDCLAGCLATVVGGLGGISWGVDGFCVGTCLACGIHLIRPPAPGPVVEVPTSPIPPYGPRINLPRYPWGNPNSPIPSLPGPTPPPTWPYPPFIDLPPSLPPPFVNWPPYLSRELDPL